MQSSPTTFSSKHYLGFYLWLRRELAPAYLALAHARRAIVWPEPQGPSSDEPSPACPQYHSALSVSRPLYRPTLANRLRCRTLRHSPAPCRIRRLDLRTKRPAQHHLLHFDSLGLCPVCAQGQPNPTLGYPLRTGLASLPCGCLQDLFARSGLFRARPHEQTHVGNRPFPALAPGFLAPEPIPFQHSQPIFNGCRRPDRSTRHLAKVGLRENPLLRPRPFGQHDHFPGARAGSCLSFAVALHLPPGKRFRLLR